MEVIINGEHYVKKPDFLNNHHFTERRIIEALNIVLDTDAGKRITIRQYLEAVLTRLWIYEDRFNSKSPWGNSNWQWVVYTAIAQHGHIDCTMINHGDDDDPDIECHFDEAQAKAYVLDMIGYIFSEVKSL